MGDVTSQILVFYMHNLEEVLLQITVCVCAMYFCSLRTQVSNRRIQFSLDIDIHRNLRSSFFIMPLRRSAAQS